MVGKNALLEKLRKDAPSVRTVEELLEQQKEEWVADLGELMAKLTDWLADGIKEGLVKVEQRSVELAEEDLGAYEAPALTIHLRTAHPRSVKIEPKGMRIVGVIATGESRIVGARGRVDLTCGAARAILLRWKGAPHKDAAGTVWKLISRKGDQVELTEDAFSDALGELIE